MHARCAWIAFVVVTLSGFARAADGDVLTLDARGAPGLDAERLRAAVAAETHRPVELAGDVAPSAGRERVVVTLAGGRVRVRFEPRPIERDAPAEASADAQIHQVALLARNLTRSEADELLLQRSGTKTPKDAEDAPPAPEPTRLDEQAYARLEATLRYHIEAERSADLPLGISELVLAAGMIPLGLYVRNGLDLEPGGGVFIGLGISIGVMGLVNLLPIFPRPLGLRKAHAMLVAGRAEGKPTRALVAEAEAQWRSQAAGVRSLRKWTAGIGGAVGATSVAFGAAFVLTTRPHNRADEGKETAGAVLVGLGGALLALSVYQWFVPSTDERNYEAYRIASGRFKATPAVAYVPGGAAFSLRGSF